MKFPKWCCCFNVNTKTTDNLPLIISENNSIKNNIPENIILETKIISQDIKQDAQIIYQDITNINNNIKKDDQEVINISNNIEVGITAVEKVTQEIQNNSQTINNLGQNIQNITGIKCENTIQQITGETQKINVDLQTINKYNDKINTIAKIV